MKKGLISMFFGFIFIAALFSTAQAQMCGCKEAKDGGTQKGGMMDGMGGMQCGGMLMDDDHPMLKSLGLDDKQKDSLKTLRSKTMKEMAKRRADKQIADIELKDLLDKDPMDMKATEASLKKNESLKTDMVMAHIKAREEMKSFLTPDQKKRLKEMMDAGRGAGCGMMSGDAERKDLPKHQHMH